jgi:uncharacterized protein (TIGR03435 family)
MKSLMRWIVLVGMLSGHVAHAQSVTGSWQGTLNPGKELRIVFVISNANAGGLAAMMYSIDQGGPGFAASAVTFQGTTLRMAIAGIGGAFEGQMSADGSSISGTWTQGSGKLPLTLVRATPETAWKIPAPPKAMAADAPAVFDVATIKPSDPDRPGKLFTFKGRQFMTINTTVRDLITFCYEVQARQIIGAPAWIESEKYDVTGQPQGDGQPNERQLKTMMQKLLADRLNFAIHRESRVLPVYALVVGETGPKLTKNDSSPNGLPSLFFKGLGVLPALNASMSDLARVMQNVVLDRPVVDRTGLSGRFDFTLTWTPDDSQFAGLGVRVPPPSTDVNAPPGLFTAIQEQLGLKLDNTKAPVEVLVVDRVEKPSEN